MLPDAVALTNGRILTMSRQKAEVTALGFIGERIACIGSDEEVPAQMPAGARRIDLAGRMVIPGLIDSHAHIMWHGGAMLRWADLTGAASVAEIQQRLRDHHEKMEKIGGSAAEWVLGIRFDHEILAEKRFPTKQELDQVVPGLPVAIIRLCGHAAVANSKALEIGGIESETGLLTENDPEPIWKEIPDPSPAELLDIARAVTDLAIQAGLTTIHALLSSSDEIRVMQKLHAKSELKMRLRVQIPFGMLTAASNIGLMSDFGDSMLRLGSVKLFSDGSMGARTAALTAPYSDDPSTSGILIHTHEDLVKRAKRGHAAGFQLAIHAIGDLAIDHSLDAIEAALKSDKSTGVERRHRIEHASIIRPDQVERMAKLGVIACVQPQFINTDFWTCDRVGPERRAWVYPFKSMMGKGVPMAGGSDCPVEELNPFQGIQRAHLRDEATVGERISIEDAIRLYTMGSAYAEFAENEKGSLEPGKLADLLVLPCDLREIDPTQIEHVRPEMVFVGGREVVGR